MSQPTTQKNPSKMASSAKQAGKENGSQALEFAGRVGYATKGIVYMIVGGLAAAAAWGAGGETTGSKGAIAEIGSQPFGRILLWVVAIGLAAYCVWRLVEAFVDPDHEGTDAKGIAKRLGYAASGIAYGLLAWTAAPFSASSASGSQGSGSKQSMVAQLIALPAGKWIVGAVGLAVLGYGIYLVYKGLTDKFLDKYNSAEMSQTEQKVARNSGRLGLSARGVTFGIIGVFIVIAAVTLDPSKTKGVGEALDVLARQPYGAWILLLVAIGLVCYGLFCMVQARYRDFHVSGAH